jgi:hypothetical protein
MLRFQDEPIAAAIQRRSNPPIGLLRADAEMIELSWVILPPHGGNWRLKSASGAFGKVTGSEQ